MLFYSFRNFHVIFLIFDFPVGWGANSLPGTPGDAHVWTIYGGIQTNIFGFPRLYMYHMIKHKIWVNRHIQHFFPFWFPLKTPLLYHNSFEYHSMTCWGHINVCDNQYETIITLLFVVNPFIKYLFVVIFVLYIYDLFVVPNLYHDWYIHHI